MLTLSTLTQHTIGSPSQSNEERKRNKRHSNRKRRIKTATIYGWHNFIYKNPKDATKKLLEIMNKCSEVSGCKINVQKSVAFLYTNNELAEREIKRTIPITITTKE